MTEKEKEEILGLLKHKYGPCSGCDDYDVGSLDDCATICDGVTERREFDRIIQLIEEAI